MSWRPCLTREFEKYNTAMRVWNTRTPLSDSQSSFQQQPRRWSDRRWPSVLQRTCQSDIYWSVAFRWGRWSVRKTLWSAKIVMFSLIEDWLFSFTHFFLVNSRLHVNHDSFIFCTLFIKFCYILFSIIIIKLNNILFSIIMFIFIKKYIYKNLFWI